MFNINTNKNQQRIYQFAQVNFSSVDCVRVDEVDDLLQRLKLQVRVPNFDPTGST
jgi:hypothetical protein